MNLRLLFVIKQVVYCYNEINNIFLSPMADGPIKFSGNLVDDLNVVNISKFGEILVL